MIEDIEVITRLILPKTHRNLSEDSLEEAFELIYKIKNDPDVLTLRIYDGLIRTLFLYTHPKNLDIAFELEGLISKHIIMVIMGSSKLQEDAWIVQDYHTKQVFYSMGAN